MPLIEENDNLSNDDLIYHDKDDDIDILLPSRIMSYLVVNINIFFLHQMASFLHRKFTQIYNSRT